MPLERVWFDDEHSIIKVTIASDTTWDEYDSAIEWIVAEAQKVDHRIDIIFYDDVGMPAGNPIPHLKRGIGKLFKQPNIRLSIIAGSRGSSGFVRSILESLAKSFMRGSTGNPDIFARTFDDALKRIQADRARIEIPSG